MILLSSHCNVIVLCRHFEYTWSIISWYHVVSVLADCVALTHWGRVTHICVSKLSIIGSDNGLSPGRRQPIIWTNAGILLIRTLGINFSEILSEIHAFSFKKMHLKMSSAKRRPFCLGLNVLIGQSFAWLSLCIYIKWLMKYIHRTIVLSCLASASEMASGPRTNRVNWTIFITSNIRCTRPQNLNVFVSSCSCICAIYWSQVLSREWRCIWNSADRRCCPNYIWVISSSIGYYDAAYNWFF